MLVFVVCDDCENPIGVHRTLDDAKEWILKQNVTLKFGLSRINGKKTWAVDEWEHVYYEIHEVWSFL